MNIYELHEEMLADIGRLQSPRRGPAELPEIRVRREDALEPLPADYPAARVVPYQRVLRDPYPAELRDEPDVVLEAMASGTTRTTVAGRRMAADELAHRRAR